jgi:hypothetical protein
MRISVNKADKAYDEKWHFADVEVLLDGKPVTAMTADTDTGYVKHYSTDAEGEWIKDENGGKILVESFGKVEIIGDLT